MGGFSIVILIFRGVVPFRRTATPLVDFLKEKPPCTSVFDGGFFGEVPPEKGDLSFPKRGKKGNGRIGTARFIDL